MFRVAVLLQLTMLVSASIYADEHIEGRDECPLGGTVKLTEEALQSTEAISLVESALERLAGQISNCRKYKIVNIRSGTRQVVNGFNFEFEVEVESHPTEKCPGDTRIISEVIKIKIYEPATRGTEKQYTFEKIAANDG